MSNGFKRKIVLTSACSLMMSAIYSCGDNADSKKNDTYKDSVHSNNNTIDEAPAMDSAESYKRDDTYRDEYR